MKSRRLIFITLSVLLLLLAQNNIRANYGQQEDDSEDQRDLIRRITKDIPNNLAKSRKRSHSRGGPSIKGSNKRPEYKLVSSSLREKISVAGVDIGFTFWLLKDSRPDDSADVIEQKERITKIKKADDVTEKKEKVSITPQRANSNTIFNNGDWLRFSLDLPAERYVYIFNREKYEDGTLSDAYLIFPRKTDQGHSDKSVAGKLLFIPNNTDYFEIEESINKENKIKTEEVYYILISPTRIKDIAPLEDQEPKVISSTLLRNIEQYMSPFWKLESLNEEAKAITSVEKQASTDGKGELTEDDPLPQMLYHIASKPGKPILFTISAKIKRP